jgi:hypothetical protein
MRAGARSPEELESLFEDAILTQDGESLGLLFERDAVLSADDGATVAEGRGEIVRAVTGLWRRDVRYLAHPSAILQSGDTSLVVGSHGVNVCRRGRDRCWRYAICLLSHDIDNTEGAEPCSKSAAAMS